MTTYNVNCYYIDTCFPYYLQDHHNRDNERLIGIYPYGQSEEQAAKDLMAEINEVAYDFPEEITNEQLRGAFMEAVENIDFTPMDESGNPAESDEPENQPTVWFYLSWTEEA